MKAPILLAFDKGLKIITTITNPDHLGPAYEYVKLFGRMYGYGGYYEQLDHMYDLKLDELTINTVI